MNTEVEQHIEKALNDVRELFVKAATRIEALKPGEKVPATKLADTLAKEVGKTGAQIYPVLAYLTVGYPGIEVKRGAHGGLLRPLPKPATPVVSTDDTNKAST